MWIDWLAEGSLYAYTAVLGLLCVYGLHRYFLVYTYFRVRSQSVPARPLPDDPPYVTVQLPMYNEPLIARRVIEAACAIDYPRDRLEIQVLDDSTDETRKIVDAVVAEQQSAGCNVICIRRPDRTGYKAGALAHATVLARGELIAIFDADFVPPADILRRTVQHFADPAVGMVQCRWEHLNRESSLLTRAQAILLDGHFVIEHTARNRSGRFMSFNGTAGVWRKSAIDDAGGWQHDTLTEDLDLSYRAQLRGWKFVFLPDLTAPAELPPEMNAFKAQQHRWTKGGAQTCVKMLPRVLRGSPSWRVKIEAFFHLTSYAVYILMVLLSILMGPALMAKLIVAPVEQSTWRFILDVALFFLGTGSALSFYLISQRQLHRSWRETLWYTPALMGLGVGIALNNAIAAIEGLFLRAGEFVRTPKFGDSGAAGQDSWQKRMRGVKLRGVGVALAELAIAIYLMGFLVLILYSDRWLQNVSAALPFLGVFIFGYGYVSLQTLRGQWLARRASV